MKIGDLDPRELKSLAIADALVYRTGPFLIRLGANVSSFLQTWQRCYASLHLLPEDTVCHFRIRMLRRRGPRQLIRPQVDLYLEGEKFFAPYPLSHGFPLFEWGLNWCIATTSHQYLLLHCAALEKNGRGLLLPAKPGSGKTTLCAALVGRGWRLLSDEFGIVRQEDGMLLPMPRAAPLKNESIALMATTAPHLAYGPRYDETRKGDVVHMFPQATCLQRQAEPARPRWVVFPSYAPGAELQLAEEPPIKAFERLIRNAFNYRVTGERGFESVCRLMRETEAFSLENGSLDAAVESIETLAEDTP